MRIIPPDLPPTISALAITLGIFIFAASAIPVNIVYAHNGEDHLISQELTTPTEEATPTTTEETTESATPSASPTTQASPTQTSTVTDLETNEVTGEVIKTQNGIITIKTDSGTKEIKVYDNIKITRDGNDVKVGAIKVGDQVVATIDTNSNQAIMVKATSAQNANLQQWLIPAIIGGLILAGLIYWLIRRANKQRIKTTTTKL